jgi:single-strand DNA-binding protein
MNKTISTANLTRDIEISYTPAGKAIAKSAIAMNSYYTDAQGEKKQVTCFIDIVAYGRRAEILNQYCRKGTKLLIEGSLVLEQWTAQDGTKRQRHVIQLDSVEILTPKATQAPTGQGTLPGSN